MTVFATRGGIDLHGELTGPATAPLVVLSHGGGQSRHAWNGTAARLVADGFAVLRYDARGHGDSGWSADKDYRMTSHAQDMADVLGTLGRPACLVGASMGGVSSLLLTADHPHLVRALVLVDIVPRFAPGGVARVRDFMQSNADGFASLDEAIAAVRAYNPHRAPSDNPQGLMRSLRERDGRLHWHWDPAVVGETANEGVAEMLSRSLAAVPPALPLLLISGAQSDVVDADAVAGFLHDAPQAETVVIDRAGHMVAGDRNDAFADAISTFLVRTIRDQTADAPP